MRIIGGRFKNKKILLPVDKNTRPLKDMVRESIFNIIEHSNLFENKIFNSLVLDLYSGSGSFGLECLSRGASKVVFCESYLSVFLSRATRGFRFRDAFNFIHRYRLF